jgi:hypothetical protein
MTDLEEIRQRLSRISNLTQLPLSDLEKLKIKFHGLPVDYLDFLHVVGFGNLEELQIYSGPVSSGSIYPKPEGDLSDVKLFGDDFQGYCFGFDTRRGYSLVDVDPRGNASPRAEKDFLTLIASYFPN